MIKFIKWFFSPSKKEVIEPYLYEKLIELEDRILALEDANVEQSNSLYECWNSLDARIDILTLEKWTDKDV